MTENRQRRSKRGTGDMKPFGRVLNRMMVEREIYEWKDLVEKMRSPEYSIEPSKLSGYLYGERHPRDPEDFFGRIAEVLDLSSDEKRELMFAYGFPSTYEGSSVSNSRAQKIAAAEQKIAERSERTSEAGHAGSG